MNTEELARRLADGESINWQLIDESDPILAGLKKLGHYYKSLTIDASDDPPRHQARLGEWGSHYLIELIGSGTFGEVYRAFDPMLQRDVALKVIGNPEACMLDSEDFIAEAQRLAQVRHRNVLAVYGAGYQGREVGFWCELLLGQTLEDALSSGQPFAWDDGLGVMSDLGQALRAVHQAGLIHGDIKAANVMLEPERGAVLLDFGAGIDSNAQGALGILQGTPLYMAPEVLHGEPVSQASDVYALGVLFFRLLSGRFPSTAATLGELRAQVSESVEISRGSFKACPREFRKLLSEMLARDPEHRPDAEALVNKIDWLKGIPARRMRRRVATAIASLLIGITIASTLGYWFASRAQKQMEAARAETQSVNTVLTNMLASASPLKDGRDVRVVEVLFHAENEVQQGAVLPEEVKSEVLLTLASTYLALRELDHAERILDELLGSGIVLPGSRGAWRAKNLLAQVFIAKRTWPQAIAMSEDAVRLATSIDPQSDMVLESEITLAGSFAEHNEPAVAMTRLEQALARFPDAPNDLAGRAHLVLGRLHEQQGRPAEAQVLYQQAADLFLETNGSHNANTIAAHAAVASVMGQQGLGPQASDLLRQQLDIAADFLGLDHRTTYNIRMNLGAVLADYGDTEAALAVQREVYASSERAFGADGLQTILSRGNVATLLVKQGNSEEAESIYRDNIRRMNATHPDEHNYRLIQEFNLAELLNELGRYQESRVLAEASLAAATQHLGAISIVGMELFESIARSDLGLGEAALAEQEFAQSVQTKSEHLGERHPLTLNALVRQADALLALGRIDEARNLLTTALEGRKALFGAEHSETLALETRLAEL